MSEAAVDELTAIFASHLAKLPKEEQVARPKAMHRTALKVKSAHSKNSAMISSKRVAPGSVVEFPEQGNLGMFEVVGVEDGKVILRRYPRRLNVSSRWWLPYPYVRKHAAFVSKFELEMRSKRNK